VPADVGDVRVRIVKPVGAPSGSPVILADRSPEVQYPVAIEQAYATAQWLTAHGEELGLDVSRLAVAGDSVGGNMTAAVAILAKQRGDVTFVHQSMYYPVTDAAQDTDSYRSSPKVHT
jgi:acetyl esterase